MIIRMENGKWQNDEKEIFKKLLQKCYRFLSLRNRTEKEMKDYLNKKINKLSLNNPDKFVNLILKRLKEEGLIDDRKFISWWVEQRSEFKQKGLIALKQELILKGIDKELINQYFSENKIDELTLAKNALQKKLKTFKKLKKEECYQKVINFLLRRGFSFKVANQVLRFYFQKPQPLDW